jgi:signal transduction histidine kinase
LIEAHDEERTRIARELHDDFSQRVALLAMRLGGMKRDLPASAANLRQSIGEASNQILELGNDIRALSHRLDSSRLQYLGLSMAAASFCKELSERHGVAIYFHSDGIPEELPQGTSLNLYRPPFNFGMSKFRLNHPMRNRATVQFIESLRS